MEEVHAGHGPYFILLFVLHEAYHALTIALVFIVLALLDLLGGHLSER